MPLESGMYAATVSRRKQKIPLPNDNFVLAVKVIEDMRASTGMGWRNFPSFLQIVTRDLELGLVGR